jgi:hypothetical protein
LVTKTQAEAAASRIGHRAVPVCGELMIFRQNQQFATHKLKRKSEELARLAMESAGRAKDIIMSGGSSEASAPAAVEADSVTKETEK